MVLPPTFRLITAVITFLCLAHIHGSAGFIVRDDESFLQQPRYQTQEDIEDLFAHLEKIYPEYAHVETIGRSLEGRNIIALQIGRHAQNRNLLTPMVKYIGNMHGDETVGRQLLVYLAQYLLHNYKSNPEIAALINTTSINLLPTMNPDGFARSQEGSCESLTNYVGRTNAVGIDLNRDFPDRLENQHTILTHSYTRQPETAALMEWIVNKPFVLSANFHGGAVVASYPYDNSIAHHECCVESLTPDDAIFKLLAHTYANNNPVMRAGNSCNETFKDGITNGAHWYDLNGGMQDFNYAFTNCFELTIELSCCKYPPASTLPNEWLHNKRSLLELIKLAHIGVKGVVKDGSGYPIPDASIVVSGLEDKPIRTSKRGEYWRLLMPGTYDVQAVAFGYEPSQPQKIHVNNQNQEALRLDFVLVPVQSKFEGKFRQIKSESAELERSEREQKYGGFLTSTPFVHHNYTAMEKYLRDIVAAYPKITRLYSIGKSVQQRDLWVLELFAQPGAHVPGIPEFKYVANMHGNEVVGKEMLLLLTKYMCERYLIDDRITRLVNGTRMHFLYSMNPDGYEMAHEGDKTSAVGRANANDIDLNRNFPDQYGTDDLNRKTEPEVSAVMNWTQSLPFVLSANLHGGSLVANYPFDDNENDFRNPMARLRLSNNGFQRKMNPTDDNALFQHLALVYANAHPTMHLGHPCPLFKNEVFPGGITNGAKWYSVTGGMQDWNYVGAGVMELTLELGCDKFPLASELPKYWDANREPLLLFIEQVHNGVHGFVKSSIGTAIAGARIAMDSATHAVYSSTHGDYWKLALPGHHNLTVVADNFASQQESFEITNDALSLRYDITLMRDDPQHWSSANDYRIIENVVHTRYHSNGVLRQQMAEFENQNGQIATFGFAESEFGFYYNTIKLTSDIGEPEESKFKILIMSSLFDAITPLGREIVINTARHVIEGYRIREPFIMELLHRSILIFLPTIANVDNIIRQYEENATLCDPILGNELADRILSPEVEKKRDLFLQFLNAEQFDLMLSFTSGSTEISYPKDQALYEKFAHSIRHVDFGFQTPQCASTPTRTHQEQSIERLTNLFNKIYNIPMFTLSLDCCRMPPQDKIAAIWRKNLDKIKNFLSLTRTGIEGHVQTESGEPIRTAYVRLQEFKKLYNVTKNAAKFQIILPPGDYLVEVGAQNYETRTDRITVQENVLRNLNAIVLSPYSLVTSHTEVRPLGTIGTVTTTATISGHVLDMGNHPIQHAKVYVIEPKSKHYYHRNYTDSMGAYSISGIVQHGNVGDADITLKVEAPHFDSSTLSVHVAASSIGDISGVNFHLTANEYIWGMPRMLFILIVSFIAIFIMIVCYMGVRFTLERGKKFGAEKRYYNFSLLPQKSKDTLFNDDGDDDDGETELFRSPIKKGVSIRPYYDDDKPPAQFSHDESDSEVDIAEEFAEDHGEEIIMLNRRINAL